MRKLNASFVFLFAVAIVALLADYFVFFLKASYIVALILSATITFLVGFSLHKTIAKNIAINIHPADIFFFACLTVAFFLNISAPPVDYDTINYHVYLQENPFIDKINFDYFTGKSLNSFLFPLGDRMHYIFRFFLGYRLGVILSYVAVICLYYQVKRILKYLVTNKQNHRLVPLAACIAVLAPTTLNYWINTYYIDLFSIVFALEIIIQCLGVKNNHKLSNKEALFIAAITGIATAIKVTNAVLIIPILLLTKFYKHIKCSRSAIVLSLATTILPITPYAIDNIIQTGSPLFPYYNSFFKSPFFTDANFQDPRFGVSKLLLFLIWPIYTSVINPYYGDESGMYDITWAIGYIAVLIILRLSYSHKIKTLNHDVRFLSFVSLLCTLIWVFVLQGYMRYALVIPVVYLTILACALLEIKRITAVICAALVPTMIFAPRFLYMRIFNFLEPSKMLNDKNITIHIDGIWGVIEDDSALTVLVREEGTPIYNLDIAQNITTQSMLEKTKQKIENKEFYVLIDDNPRDFRRENKLEYIERSGYKVVEVVKVYDSFELPYISKYCTATLYKVRYAKDFPTQPEYNASYLYPSSNTYYD